MGDSRSRQQARLQERMGDDAKVKLIPTPHAPQPFAYRVQCRVCPSESTWLSKGSRASTYDTYARCLEGWDVHVRERHTPERLAAAHAEHELLQAERDAHWEHAQRDDLK